MQRKNQNLGSRRRLANPPGRFHPVQIGHADVQDNNIGLQLLSLSDCFTAGLSFAADFPSRMSLQQVFYSTPHQVVIVGNEYAQGLHEYLREYIEVEYIQCPLELS